MNRELATYPADGYWDDHSENLRKIVSSAEGADAFLDGVTVYYTTRGHVDALEWPDELDERYAHD